MYKSNLEVIRMKYGRIKEMEEYIKEHASVSNDELLNIFNISIQTLRRDLKTLEEQGIVSKVYGGVVYNTNDQKNVVSPIMERKNVSSKEKEYIGRLAADQVADGDVIFIDSGTTAYRMIPFLKNKKNVTVISHSLDVMNTLLEYPTITGVCSGGTLMTDSATFLVDTSYYPYNYNKSFISTVGISVSRSFTNTNLHEGQMKQHAIEHSSKVYIVADHSKFDVIAFNHFADYADINAVITDRQPSERYMRIFDSNQIKVIF